jgi:hypothetical protein
MSLARNDREENHRDAFRLMIESLGDRPIDTTLFDADHTAFHAVLRTTWEELERSDYVSAIGSRRYRLTPKGWLLGLEIAGLSQSKPYAERLGKLFAAMKRRVKGRKGSAVIDLRTLSEESGEPEGWIFNVVDSRASTGENFRRTGAGWFDNERGRLIEIPVDFNLEPVDIASALTISHLETIEELEAKLEAAEEDRGEFRCPYCDSRVASIAHQDYPDHHCIVTYHSYECGYVTGDGYEESPCPYGPKWPKPDEFEVICEQTGSIWRCHAIPKTDRARGVSIMGQGGRNKEEAEARIRAAIQPRKGESLPEGWFAP